jgi:RimJ/RimL family protein N-acetyltransferase
MFDGHASLPDLDTERLVLRWLTAADAPSLFEVFGDDEVCRYWSRPALADLAAADALLGEIHAAFESRSLFQWGIAERESGRVVGTCTLAGVSAEHRRAEVGIALGRAHWGRGYATEALARLVRCAFQDLNLNRLEADADPRNVASMRVLDKAGFRPEGLARERYLMHGEFQDAVLYGLLREDWIGA